MKWFVSLVIIAITLVLMGFNNKEERPTSPEVRSTPLNPQVKNETKILQLPKYSLQKEQIKDYLELTNSEKIILNKIRSNYDREVLIDPKLIKRKIYEQERFYLSNKPLNYEVRCLSQVKNCLDEELPDENNIDLKVCVTKRKNCDSEQKAYEESDDNYSNYLANLFKTDPDQALKEYQERLEYIETKRDLSAEKYDQASNPDFMCEVAEHSSCPSHLDEDNLHDHNSHPIFCHPGSDQDCIKDE